MTHRQQHRELPHLRSYGQLRASKGGRADGLQWCGSWAVNYTAVDGPTPRNMWTAKPGVDGLLNLRRLKVAKLGGLGGG